MCKNNKLGERLIKHEDQFGKFCSDKNRKLCHASALVVVCRNHHDYDYNLTARRLLVEKAVNHTLILDCHAKSTC